MVLGDQFLRYRILYIIGHFVSNGNLTVLDFVAYLCAYIWYQQTTYFSSHNIYVSM